MMLATLLVLLQSVQVPTFATQAQMVEVTVSATDERTGAPISDLKFEDLSVLENGRRQEIRHFGLEPVPASVVILLDASNSMGPMLSSIREAASNLIHSLRPVDEVHVAMFDVHYRVLCDFTTDHEIAVKSLEGMEAGSNTALNMALYQATRRLERQHGGELERRRILILLSDGEDTHSDFSIEDAVENSYKSAEDVLRRSTIVCYVVHIQRAPLSTPPVSALAERAARFVQFLAYETGGRLVSVQPPFHRREIVNAFSDIATELGSQYHLGYASSADPSNAGWRTIGVVLHGRSGVRLRFRRGYYAALRR